MYIIHIYIMLSFSFTFRTNTKLTKDGINSNVIHDIKTYP